MRLVTTATLLACSHSYASGLTPTNRLMPQSFSCTAPIRARTMKVSFTSLLYASQNEEDSPSLSSADNLLRMVEEISNDQFSPAVIAKMQELEQVLTAFLDEQGKEKYKQKWSPRPPGTPPPLRVLQNLDAQQGSLAKAEIALEKLRERLRREEEALRLAEEALQQSLHEEEILRRAEEALQRSREAAERRKFEAIRQTEAAVVSAEIARRDSEEAAQAWGQQQSATPSSSKNLDDVGDENDNSLYRGTEAPRSTIPVNLLAGPKGTPVKVSKISVDSSNNDAEAPDGVTILCNWVQYIDGSIQGQVRRSDKFEDGTVIATSAVQLGVKAGSVIETSSGSRYYLAMPTEQNEVADPNQVVPSESSVPRMARAPEGVPSIMSWKTLDNGGIAGFIYGSRNAEDGDYIETSPVSDAVIESGQVINTESGSRYFLSPDKSERVANSMAAFQDLIEARRGSTITITKTLASRNRYATESQDTNQSTSTPLGSKPRPTFSLFSLFGKSDTIISRKTGGKTGPDGVPMLTNWSANPDGTVTGIVSGSPHLNDGDMVTTSPIVSGTLEHDATVITETGSTYYLA